MCCQQKVGTQSVEEKMKGGRGISDYIRELPLFGINDPIGRLPYGGLKVSF